MSEYQSYEFRALERPLSPELQAKLRRISSRGEITSTSFSNEYEWGDFKGDPEALMWEGFDVFVYYANWGHRWCMIRLPAGAFDPEAEAYGNEALSIRRSDSHVLLSFAYEDEPPDYDDLEPWIDRLVGLRAELLAGDRRPLMIGWLAGLWGFEDEDELPPVPPGMGQLTSAQVELSDFLYVEADLLDAVAERSGEAAAPPTREAAAAWLAAQPAAAKEAWLLRLLVDQPAYLGAELWASFRRSLPAPVGPTEAWAVGELRAREQTIAEERKRQAAEARERARLQREQAERDARERRLNALEGRETELRLKVVELTAATSQAGYDEAVQLMRDLQGLAERQGDLSAFELWVAELRESRRRKSSLIRRMDQAGL